ncbi:MAG: TIGR04283 family arsenosugar biosynthesis glycosyltransferase [Bacteroidota bacterium]|jgi:rSAM/selenodomain-associated transferase 2|nr:TIGR04283 family arsenosugar biosynthesis glycosyltransferase [Bacteroidota bacterium]
MISIIIPTYNEASQIAETIRKTLAARGDHETEIIIVDGGSMDNTVSIARECGVKTVLSEHKGRAAQMNKGAAVAQGDIFYFLHADSIPPVNFTNYIIDALAKGFSSGCFRLSFDYDHWFLKANCWFTRFDINAVRFGDQSLFVTKKIFQSIGGFKEDILMMEDQEIIHRIKEYGKFVVMNGTINTSARKYLDNGIYRLQVIFFLIWFLYYSGYSQEHLLKLHRKLIHKHKL